MHAHFRRQWMIEQERTHPIVNATLPAIESPPSDPDKTSHPVPATKSNPPVKPKIPVKKLKPRVIKPTPLIPAALSNDSPLVVIDISSPVVVKKSNPRVKPSTPVIAAAPSTKPPPVIDISNDKETESHNEEMELKTVVTIADVHQQAPKEKATGTKPKIRKPISPVNEMKSQPIRL